MFRRGETPMAGLTALSGRSAWLRNAPPAAPCGGLAGGSAELDQCPAEVADGLSGPVLVLDEGEADVAVAAGAEPDAGRGGDVGLLHQEAGELQRAQLAVRLGDRRP